MTKRGLAGSYLPRPDPSHYQPHHHHSTTERIRNTIVALPRLPFIAIATCARRLGTDLRGHRRVPTACASQNPRRVAVNTTAQGAISSTPRPQAPLLARRHVSARGPPVQARRARARLARLKPAEEAHQSTSLAAQDSRELRGHHSTRGGCWRPPRPAVERAAASW